MCHLNFLSKGCYQFNVIPGFWNELDMVKIFPVKLCVLAEMLKYPMGELNENVCFYKGKDKLLLRDCTTMHRVEHISQIDKSKIFFS